MKTIKTTSALLLALWMTATFAPAMGITPIGRVARSKDIPGKFVENDCKVYAVALAKRLNAAGTEARVVVYDWTQVDNKGAVDGRHAVVVYKDGDRTYAMDNMSWTPKRVSGDKTSDIAQSFAGAGVYVASVWELDGRVLVASN